jgi:Mce-associated membrane protein
VDVAAVRPDELEPDDGAPPPTARRPRGGAAVLVTASVVLTALLAVLVVLLFQGSGRNARDDTRRGAAAAARAEALSLTTIRYQTADADLRRILAGATGKLRAQFAAEQPHFADVLTRDKSRSEGNVLAVGVVDISAPKGTARVVVAADATVTTTAANGRDQSVLKHYRMVLRLVKLRGQWLVSDVAFAGEPQ